MEGIRIGYRSSCFFGKVSIFGGFLRGDLRRAEDALGIGRTIEQDRLRGILAVAAFAPLLVTTPAVTVALQAVQEIGAGVWMAGVAVRLPAPANGSRGVVPAVERALARTLPDEFTLPLAHSPALWPELAARGVDLTLSGHTHHGQFAIPEWRWRLASVFRYFSSTPWVCTIRTAHCFISVQEPTSGALPPGSAHSPGSPL